MVELDAASNNGVDNVRALRDEAIYSPASVKKRVYIIDEVHMLSTSAFNALLKILEEPPEHLMFILATTELHKVPATILSRCQRHSFRRIDPDTLAERLRYVAEQESMHLEPNAASLLARLADGSLRDGLSLLDQCSGTVDITAESVLSAMGLAGNLRIAELLDATINGETGRAVGLFGELWRDGKAPATLLSELGTLLRDILMIKVAPKGGRELLSGGYDFGTLDSFEKRMTQDELIGNIDSIQKHIGSLRDGRNPKTDAEICLVELCEPQLVDSLDALKKRVARLEAVLENGAESFASRREKPHSEGKNSSAAPASEEERQPILKREEREVLENDALPFAPAEGAAGREADGGEHSEENLSSGEAAPDDVWQRMLPELKQTMLPGQYNLIGSVNAQFCAGALTIKTANSFQKGQLEQSKVMECIRSAAQKVLGRPAQIKIEVASEASRPDVEKLGVLSKFGNVKFE